MTVRKKTALFEEGIERLEKIASEMEQGDLSLEELMTLYEEGMKLSAKLTRKLDEAENRMLLLSQNENGQTEITDITDEMK